ncbi:MAG: sigma-70 family RNA polymerase sigma factor [Nocardiopsaceae bacterium]|nr:sigma-70 family RNA polymerase sigma factor [Nocardiopsaceae bacterium]
MIAVGDGVTARGNEDRDDSRGRIASLAEAAREGHQDAIGELVTELTPVLWQVARAAGLSAPDAEDVVQTAWLSLMSHLDAIRTPASLTSWLVTTTRREAWRVRAAGRRQQPADGEWLQSIPDPGVGAEENVVLKDEHRRLRAAFRTLPQRCQELLRIVAFVPRPDYGAVAASLGMPRGSIGPTRSRCLARLRSALLNGEGGQP